jgi:enterochelin esterase-like enzyme
MKHFLLILSIVAGSAASAQEPPLTPTGLRTALAAKPSGAEAARLADRVRAAFGKSNLPKGPAPKVEGLNVAWAIEAPAGAQPRVVSEDSSFSLLLARLGETDVYAGVAVLADGAAMRWRYEGAGQNADLQQLEVYQPHPDSLEQPGVPKGKLTQMSAWESKVFPGTTRDWWIYVPAQYRPEQPACVMVWQDGAGAKNFVPTVFDNLIAKGDMPVTVGIFVEPGTKVGSMRPRGNRSFEYDTLSDQYARFLLEEILPEVEKTVRLRHDANSRAIAGSSSGGICAFTAAWEHPEAFGKVHSWVGSFTNIASGPTLREGGHNYPALIRKTDRKPLRVFLQDGANDLDNPHGNWPLANQQMAKALAFKDYDYRFVYGNGFHSGKHGQAILPDSLRWLWRGYRAE